MDTSTVETLATVASQFGIGAIFLYLYLVERKDHNRTRQKYNDDLRDAAGFEARGLLHPPPLPDEDDA